MDSPDTTTCSTPGPDQERLARILDDYLVAIEQGLPVTPEALLAKYPNDAAQLRGYLSGLQLFHAAAGVPQQAQGPPIIGPLPQPMQMFGDYQLVREIGRGGMGVVYEAQQLSLRRRVALKILPFTVANDAKQISRFKNEAQAAAQVQHPNIVPVYTVGEENGVHFYVMQLIEGQSLTSLLDGLRTSGHESHGTTAPNYPDLTITWPRGRNVPRHTSATPPYVEPVISPMKSAETADHIRVVARLAQQAAEALDAAHEYGIVHRDVKPSNLLLDDQGKLWVTDFGLARCREQQGLTQTGDVLGTMRYMSPEQARGKAALVDQRSDIYSLGITMYELATLHHPADGISDLQLYFDRERQAPKPLRQWNRHIPADFQTIVLKCLSEFPQERYSTAQELADDLGRFLEGRPIMASPPSLVSRISKWAKRRRGIVYASAAVLLVALIAIGTSMTMMAREKAADQARVLTQARDHLHQTHALLDRFATQLVDQLAYIPGAEGVRHELLQDCLELYNKLQRESINDPALAADLALAYSKLGSLSEKMKKSDEALDAHTKALDVWQRLGTRSPSNFEYAQNVALCKNNIGLLMAQGGHTSEGLALLESARDSHAKLLAADPASIELATNLAATYGNLGLVLKQFGSKSDALKDFAEAITIQERLAKAPDASENVLHTLAASYQNFGFLQDDSHADLAADAYKKAIAIQMKLVSGNGINRIYQVELANTYNNLGFLYARGKEWKNAELCYTDAIKIQEELVRQSRVLSTFRRDLAISYNNLGMAQSHVGRFVEAETSFQNSIQLQDALLVAQPGDAEIRCNQGSVFNNLGKLFDQQRRYPDGEKAYKQAIANQRRAYDSAPGNDHYRALLSGFYLNFGRNLSKQAKFDEAMQAAAERKQLWQGNAELLNSVAQQLAVTYGMMRISNAPQQSQAVCLRLAVTTLREAVAAGLPTVRLNDASLKNIANSEDFRKLIEETAENSAKPAATQQSALGPTN